MKSFLVSLACAAFLCPSAWADGSNPYIGRPPTPPGCERPYYSALHYWAPQWFRTPGYLRRPGTDRYKYVDRYPDVPATFKQYDLPCRYSDPARITPLYGR